MKFLQPWQETSMMAVFGERYKWARDGGTMINWTAWKGN